MGHSFVRSLALLIHSLAPPCLLLSRTLLRSLVHSLAHFAHSLAHFAHSLARGTVIYKMAILSVFYSIFDHGVMGPFVEAHFYTKVCPSVRW